MILPKGIITLVLFFALALLWPAAIVDSYPTRAGHCESGAQIGEASGGVHGRQGSGSLEKGNFTVSIDINGTIILDGVQVLELVAGENYTITIEGRSEPFRGVLVRVSGINGEKLQDSLEATDDRTQRLPSTGDTVGFQSACAEDVAGLCHNSRLDKNSIATGLMVQEDADVLLEVTIVTNNGGGGRNDWYYGSYQMNVRIQSTNSTTNSTTGEDLSDGGGGKAIEGNGTDTEGITNSTDSEDLSDGDGGEAIEGNETDTEGMTNSTASEDLSDGDGGEAIEGNGTDTEGTTNGTASEDLSDGDGGEVTEGNGTDIEGEGGSGANETLGACKWFCAVIPTPWISEGLGDHPKCNWIYSCSACDECKSKSR